MTPPASPVPPSSPTRGERARRGAVMTALLGLVLAMLLPGGLALAADATVTVPETATLGQKLVLKGSGWTVKDGSSGSVVAVKLDQGSVSRTYALNDPIKGTELKNKTIWGVGTADSQGNFEIQVDLPDGSNSDIEAWKEGEKHTVTFLSGSMKTGDEVRSESADVTIVAPEPEPEPDPADPTLQVSPEVQADGKIIVSGTGWKTADGTAGSVVAVKLDGGGVQRSFDLTNPATGQAVPNKGVWGIAQAAADGTFTMEVPVPSAANTVSKTPWKAGETHTVTALSGSLLTGDATRSKDGTVKVAGTPEATSAAITVEKHQIGEKLVVTGTGWTDQAGTGGSTVVLQLAGEQRSTDLSSAPAGVDAKDRSIWAATTAGADGAFRFEVDLPNGSNNASGAAWAAGSHAVTVRSGVVPGDVAREVSADFPLSPAATTPDPTDPGESTTCNTITRANAAKDHASGSVVAVKLDEGSVSRTGELKNPVTGAVLRNMTIWAIVHAEADGSFTLSMDLPDGKNSANGVVFKAGEEHTLTFLSGSQLTGDTVASVTESFTVEAAPVLTADPLSIDQTPVVDVPLTDPANATVVGQETSVLRGLYQTAYSKRENAIYATAAVGRPPVKDSGLVKLDADTLQVQKAVSPPVDPSATGDKAGARYAVYGVQTDDAHRHVWVTNTRQNTVAVYDEDSLELVKQFDAGTIPHARDIVIDEANHQAFVSSANSNVIAVFDTETLEKTGEITMGAAAADEATGVKKFTAMSLALDEGTHTLYTVSLSSEQYASIDTVSHKATVMDLPAGSVASASGVAVDTASKRLYIASQGTGNLLVLKAGTAQVLANVPTAQLTGEDGAPVSSGELNVAWDPVNSLAYVSNRTAGTITVHDADGKLVQTLNSGKNANHVEADGRGNVYSVNKGGGRAEGDTRDLVQRYHVAATPFVCDFTDVPESLQFHDEICWAAEQDFVRGWPDGTYRPVTPVNRDAMAAYLYRMAGEPEVTLPATSPFSDVTPDMEHYEAIVWAYQQGITTGWADGTFRPTQPIARDAMAAFVYRYAGSPATSAPTADPFSDMSTTTQYAKEVAWLKAQGITTGYEDGSYRPLSAMNRDAMAAFMYRMNTAHITHQG